MSTKPSQTVLITGGNGALGSHIAFEIAKAHSDVFFILTARRENDTQAEKIAGQLQEKGVTAFEFLALNLASLASVKAFAAKVSEKVQSKGMPPISVQVNCAAYSSYSMDERTDDNFDPVYQTNVLSPFLLTVLLLDGAFRSTRGAPGGKVVNITSQTISLGRVDFFDSWGPTEQTPIGSRLPITQGLARYGSSKLMADVAMYTLKKKLFEGGNKSVDIFSLDPGGMNHNSNLSRGATPIGIRLAANVLSLLGPLVRLFQKSLINHPSVPAAAVANAAFKSSVQSERPSYFVLDREVGLLRIEKAMHEHKEKVFEQVLKDAGVNTQQINHLIGHSDVI